MMQTVCHMRTTEFVFKQKKGPVFKTQKAYLEHLFVENKNQVYIL